MASFKLPSPRKGSGGFWVFVFIWNVIAFPIAGAALPDLARGGDWEGYFVLVFPLIGVLMAWSAFVSTIKYHRDRYRGRAS